MSRLLPRSFRFSRRRAGVVLGTTGVLSYCVYTSAVLYSDANPPERFRFPTVESKQHVLDRMKSQKRVESFDTRFPVDVDTKLREHERSRIGEKNSGISRYDIAHVSSNLPSEDDHSEVIVSTPASSWGLFALFDGHAGWETSAWLSKNLVPAVVGSLADIYSKYAESDPKTKKSPKSQQNEILSPPPNAVDDTIKDTFKRLDDDIVHAPLERVFASPSKDAAVNLLAPANAGSCALLAFYDSQTRLLRIALTGDLRAVLGRRKTDNDGNITYDVHVLSADQNAYNKDEEQRMQAQHPGEEIMKNGRVLGWGPSRAFGDARMKWNLDVQARLKKEYLGRTPYKNVKTPPYFTAEPEITTTEVKPGDFLILATDGLWESLSNPEAVGLVGMWLNHNERERKGLGRIEGSHSGVFLRSELPVVLGEDDDGTSRFSQWSAKKQYISVDHNAATHLVRNALGGADKDLTAALLSINSPRSRSYMDDITATVVFFDDK